MIEADSGYLGDIMECMMTASLLYSLVNSRKISCIISRGKLEATATGPCLQQISHNASIYDASTMQPQCNSCNSRSSAKCLHCKPAAPSPDCFSPPFQLFSTIKDGHNFKLFSKGRKPSLYGLHTKRQSISLFWTLVAVCNGGM